MDGFCQGPYIQSTRTHLQRVLGDDNVLLVKFAEEKDNNFIKNYERLSPMYQRIAEDGIAVGWRHYRFFGNSSLGFIISMILNSCIKQVYFHYHYHYDDYHIPLTSFLSFF